MRRLALLEREIGKTLEVPVVDPEEEAEPADILKTDRGILFGVTHDTPFFVVEPSDLDRAKDLARVAVWHEGGSEEPIVAGFIQENFPRASVKSWEPPRRTTEEGKDAEVVRDIFAVGFSDSHDYIFNHPGYDPDASIIENILASFGAEDAATFTEDRIRGVVEEAAADPASQQVDARVRGMPKMLDETWDGFGLLHAIGNHLVWAWKDGEKFGGTYFAKLFAGEDLRREMHLAELMTTRGGVFFAGRAHVDNVERILGGS